MSVRDQALAYLADHNVVTLATEGPDGRWAAAVFYVHDGWTLYFLSSPGSRHGRNIALHPAIAATIQEDYREWTEIRGIQMEGLAQRLSGAEEARAIECYSRKFPLIRPPAGPADAVPAASRQIQRAMSRIAWFRLVPSRLYFIDNSRGLGHRDEVLP